MSGDGGYSDSCMDRGWRRSFPHSDNRGASYQHDYASDDRQYGNGRQREIDSVHYLGSVMTGFFDGRVDHHLP